MWNWGATRSKVKQAELRLQQAHVDLSFTQRQLLANLNSFYLEANVASSQMASLKHSLDLAEESLKLTLLRYQAGEVTRARSGGRADHAAAARATPTTTDWCATAWRWPHLQTLTGAF